MPANEANAKMSSNLGIVLKLKNYLVCIVTCNIIIWILLFISYSQRLLSPSKLKRCL